MFILKKGHQPGVYVPLRALFLVCNCSVVCSRVFYRDSGRGIVRPVVMLQYIV